MPVTYTSLLPIDAVVGAVTFSVAAALPPLVKVSELGIVHVHPVGALHVRLTAPANVFNDARLMVVDALAPEVTGRMVVFAISEKSASGLEIVTTAADGLSDELVEGRYCSVIWFTPCVSDPLLTVKVKLEVLPVPGVSGTDVTTPSSAVL